MGKRVLVIDDEVAVRKAFDYALRDVDCEFELAVSGVEGVKMAVSDHYDLVYLDLRMPDLDGVGVLRKIREEKPELPVYIVTAFHREYFEDLIEARHEGLMFELLSKPLERSEIIDITNGILFGADSVKGGSGDN